MKIKTSKWEITIPPEDKNCEESSALPRGENSIIGDGESKGKQDEEKVGVRARVKRVFQKFELTADAPQNLLTAGLWQTFGTLIASFLAWLLVVIVSRDDWGLGADGVGVLNTALAFLGIFSLLTIGMSKATAQIVSEKISANVLDKREAFENARNGTIVTILTGIIIGTFSIIGSFFLGNPLDFQNILSSILFVIGIVMLITGIRDGLISNLAAVGEYDEIVKAQVTYPLFQVISSIIIIILIKTLGIPIATIVFVYIFGMVVQDLFLYKFFGRLPFNTQIFHLTKVDRRAFTLARQGFYFAVTDIIPVGLLGSATTVILLVFTHQNYIVVGAYSIVLGYAFGGLIVTGFAWPLITAVAEAYGQKNKERINYYLHLIVKIFFYITFFTLVINIGLSRGILYLFHGEIYLTGITDVWITFILVMIALTIAGFEYILCGILLGIGKGRKSAAYLGSIFVVTIGFVSLFIWLLPLINPVIFTPQLSAGAGFLVGTLVMLPFLPSLIKKQVGHSIPFAVGVRSILALLCTLIIGALLMWPPLNLIPLTSIWVFLPMAILMIIIYPLLLVFLGAISLKDVDLFERKMKEYGLEKIGGQVAGLIRKIIRISPIKPITD